MHPHRHLSLSRAPQTAKWNKIIPTTKLMLNKHHLSLEGKRMIKFTGMGPSQPTVEDISTISATMTPFAETYTE